MEQPHVDPRTGDDLRALYHGTHPRWREHIASMGLQPGVGLSNEGMLGHHPDGTPIEAGVFLTPCAEEAAEYGALVYRVDITGLDYVLLDGPEGYHYVVLNPAGIAPGRLRDA